MNAHPASPLTVAAHRSGLIPAAKIVGRAVGRVPFATQAIPIAGAFLCSYLLYGRLAGESTALGWGVLGGLVSFIALFAQLRLIDDLDDVERDHPAGTDAGRSALRARLLAGLAACMT